jgi:NAD(P)-dependent dehydrogenase (short-subunit alcohol dehydrogenase family)
VAALAASLAKEPIDLLINNAGQGVGVEGGSLGGLKVDDFDRIMQVNAIGPVRVTQALLPNLRAGRGKTIVGISSILGSIESNRDGGYYGYRESKAALDMFMRSLAGELKGDGFICIALIPGWVKTDMGGPDAPLTPEESVRGMRKVLDGLKPKDSGKLWSYDGSIIPW